MTVKRDLQNAATLLREMGWCQGEPQNSAGCFCAVGAIDAVTDSLTSYLAARGAVARVIRREMVSGWNDEFGRTAEEVIAALEAAAEAEAADV